MIFVLKTSTSPLLRVSILVLAVATQSSCAKKSGVSTPQNPGGQTADSEGAPSEALPVVSVSPQPTPASTPVPSVAPMGGTTQPPTAAPSPTATAATPIPSPTAPSWTVDTGDKPVSGDLPTPLPMRIKGSLTCTNQGNGGCLTFSGDFAAQSIRYLPVHWEPNYGKKSLQERFLQDINPIFGSCDSERQKIELNEADVKKAFVLDPEFTLESYPSFILPLISPLFFPKGYMAFKVKYSVLGSPLVISSRFAPSKELAATATVTSRKTIPYVNIGVEKHISPSEMVFNFQFNTYCKNNDQGVCLLDKSLLCEALPAIAIDLKTFSKSYKLNTLMVNPTTKAYEHLDHDMLITAEPSKFSIGNRIRLKFSGSKMANFRNCQYSAQGEFMGSGSKLIAVPNGDFKSTFQCDSKDSLTDAAQAGLDNAYSGVVLSSTSDAVGEINPRLKDFFLYDPH